jgi:hypothetical protein
MSHVRRHFLACTKAPAARAQPGGCELNIACAMAFAPGSENAVRKAQP